MIQTMKLKKCRSRSIVKTFIMVFVSLILIVTLCVGYLIFTNWYSSIEKATSELSRALNQRTFAQIDSYIKAPLNINEVNYKMIQKGIADLSDETERDKFFVSVVTSYEKDIYSFSYCTADGNYYGAIKDKNGAVEIIKNTAQTSGKTGYYAVNKDMTAGKLIESTGKTDLRTSVWYQTAVTAKTAAFSPVYKCSYLNEMAVSAVYPVYDNHGGLKGVLAARLLLPSISETLSGIVKDYGGSVAIVERGSGNLIANSSGVTNYTLSKDGALERKNLESLNNAAIEKAYQKYRDTGTTEIASDDENGKLSVHIQAYKQEGLNWVILSAVPESPLTIAMLQNIFRTIFLAGIIILSFIIAYLFISRKLLKPIKSLLNVAEKFASGDLYQRAPVVRYDEIGKISESFNQVADAMQHMINHLNETVAAKTAELSDSKEKLLLILNSTAEAIYGTDSEGNCTFCNESCLKLLGYSDSEALLGQNMNRLLHHPHNNDGTCPENECLPRQMLHGGEKFHSDCEMFRKSDGSCLDVEYNIFPQIRDGKNIGSVISFIDISERKKAEEEIRFLSCHDAMTGLLNRGRFEQVLKEFDTKVYLPASMIYIDLNGLKLLNDTFGHANGDALILKAAEILKQNCRKNDMAARVGGDEFCILLPNTESNEARLIAGRLKTEFSHHSIDSVPCSMAIGVATKWRTYQQIEKVMETAETEMYREKSVSTRSFGVDAIRSIINTLHKKYPREKRHSEEVSRLCGKLGEAMNLPEPEIRRLRDAGYLHDIGKIALSGDLMGKSPETLTEDEMYLMRQHPATGYRLLNLSEETLDLANGVYGHHEAWDGSGYPKGLKGKKIPVISRMIAVTEAYERGQSRDYDNEKSREEALQAIRDGAGARFDPQIVETFAQMINRNCKSDMNDESQQI